GLLTALYFKALRPDDRVAVKAHAAPAFYAIQYLRGRLPRSALAELRSFGWLQAYPSRRKNPEIVDLSTGSMGLGAVQARLRALFGTPEGGHLERRLETMPNAEYQRLLRLPHGAVRKALLTGAGGEIDATLDRFLSRLGDDELAALVADLGGHDLAAILDAVDEAEGEGATPGAFGRALGALARLPVAASVVTVSADVAVTTHLAGWINRKGVYFPVSKPHVLADLPLAVQWKESPGGQHIELGIAEHNL